MINFQRASDLRITYELVLILTGTVWRGTTPSADEIAEMDDPVMPNRKHIAQPFRKATYAFLDRGPCKPCFTTESCAENIPEHHGSDIRISMVSWGYVPIMLWFWNKRWVRNRQFVVIGHGGGIT